MVVPPASEAWAAVGVVAQALADDAALERVAALLVEQGARALACGAAAFWVIETSSGGPAGTVAAADAPPPLRLLARYPAAPASTGERDGLPAGAETVRRVARTGLPLVVHDAGVEGLGVGAYCVQPVLVRGLVRGVLACAWPERRSLGDGDAALWQSFAGLAAAAIDKARLRRDLALDAAVDEPTRLRRLMEANVIGLMVAERETIVEANEAFLAMVGYSRADLEAGRLGWRAMTPPDYAALDEKKGGELLATGVATPWEKAYLRADGTRVPVVVGGTLLDRARMQVLYFVLDLSEREQTRQERIRLLTEAQAAQAVTASLSEALTPAQVARAVLAEGLAALRADAGAVFRVSEDGALFELLGYWGYAAEAEGANSRVPVELSGPLGDALRAGDLVVVESPAELRARWPYLAARQTESGDAATVAAPLLVDGRALGVLYAAFRTPRTFTPTERAFVLALARQCAQALERTRLYDAERQARARAEAAQEQLGAIVEAITDSVFVVGPAGDVVHMNAAARDLFASANAGPLGPDWPLSRILGGEVLSGANAADVVVGRSDGVTRELSVTGAPLRDPSGAVAGAVCVARDVTERRRLERRTHEALSALLRMGEAMVLRYDDQDAAGGHGPAARDGAVAVAQRLVELACSVLGCRRAAISIMDAISGSMGPLAAVGLTPEQEALWRQGEPQGRLGRQLTDPLLPDLLLAGEVLALDTTHPSMRDWPNPYGLRSFLLAPLLADGQFLGVLVLDHGGTAHAFSAEEQALAGVVAKLAGLVIERDRLVRERAEARASALALREANERMDEFLNIASHELKTPLTSLMGLIQLAERRVQRETAGLQERGQDLPAVLTVLNDLLARTGRQLHRMDGLVSDLLDTSRIRAGQLALRPEQHDLAAIVREAVEELRMAWPGRTISLAGDADGVVPVLADAERINQVVTNYLTNALKYSTADVHVALALLPGAREARISVRDAGPGISPEAQAHLFQRFYRVPGLQIQSGSGLGLGLGLHISSTIVERHEGRVGVESAPGQGATFWFTLPLAAPDGEESE